MRRGKLTSLSGEEEQVVGVVIEGHDDTRRLVDRYVLDLRQTSSLPNLDLSLRRLAELFDGRRSKDGKVLSANGRPCEALKGLDERQW